MDSDLCRQKLNELIDKLPPKLRHEYHLCESTDELIEKASQILNKDKEKLKKEYFKKINSKKYKKERKKFLEHDEPHTKIFGLSTSPILLNSGEIKEVDIILFYYLHEVGHLSGFLRKKKKYHTEIIADKFALFWFHKFCIGKS